MEISFVIKCRAFNETGLQFAWCFNAHQPPTLRVFALQQLPLRSVCFGCQPNYYVCMSVVCRKWLLFEGACVPIAVHFIIDKTVITVWCPFPPASSNVPYWTNERLADLLFSCGDILALEWYALWATNRQGVPSRTVLLRSKSLK